MCGRFSLSVTGEQVAEQFELSIIPALKPRYNIAPTQNAAVVRQGASGRELAMVCWGLIPSWAKDPSIGARMINARAESIAEKPSFRAAFKQRRCLVIADGFFEWKRDEAGKQPFFFALRDGEPFAFAGLWETWRQPDGTPLETCTIITTEANEMLRPIHDRMPAILQSADYALWLDAELRDPNPLKMLLQSRPIDDLVAYPVSKHVNRVTNDDPQCIAPLN